MSESSEYECRRRDPRYVETSNDLSDWIQVKMVEQFGAQHEFSGLLIDLTPRAVKVGLPGEVSRLRKTFQTGNKMMITFRFKDLASLPATATISRVDDIQNGISILLFFEMIRESDRANIAKICDAYTRPEKTEIDVSSPS